MKILLVGFGYLAKEITRLSAEDLNIQIFAVGKSSGKAVKNLSKQSDKLPYFQCDIGKKKDVANLHRKIAHFHIDAIVQLTSTRGGSLDDYRSVYLKGARNLLKFFPNTKFAFCSSTSVYPQTRGEVVDENSPTNPSSERAKILLASEYAVQSFSQRNLIFRLAGLYGRGRSAHLRKFFAGNACVDQVELDAQVYDRWVNQIHVEDAARAILHCLENDLDGIFNVADDTPLQISILYERIHKYFPAYQKVKLLRIASDDEVFKKRKRAWTNKLVSNTKLHKTAWRPKYPSFFYALEHDKSLAQMAYDFDNPSI